MDKTVYTPTSLFGTAEISDDAAPVIECVSPHTHQERSGFLFKDLKSGHALFIANDELLADQPESGHLYFFRGFVSDSAVVSISPRI